VTHLFSYVAVGLIAAYVAVLLMLWQFQERILFQPPIGLGASSVAARRVLYRASDGAELFALVVGTCAPDRTLVLVFHGNAEVSRWLVPWASRLEHLADACVMLAEYRGYDGLSGAPTYTTSARDAQAALDYARDSLNVGRANLVLYGHSLGSAIAAELAETAHPRALILQAPFSSARAMASRMIVPGLRAFFRFISRVHFDTVARVRTSSAPVWVLVAARRSLGAREFPYSGRCSRNAIGTLIDSFNMYFHASRRLSAIGLVCVGDVSGVSP